MPISVTLKTKKIYSERHRGGTGCSFNQVCFTSGQVEIIDRLLSCEEKRSVIGLLFLGKCSREIRECSGKTQACPLKNICGHMLEVAQGIFFVSV